MRPFRLLLGLALALLTICVPPPVRADVFVLANGERVQGELLNPDESPRKTFVIKTTSGVTVTLQRAQVDQVLHPRPAEIEYDKIHHTYPDTPQGQWDLAAWCLKQNLLSQRKVHLERIIELDPDHAEARRALGYIKSEGQWTTHEALMKSRGYVYFRNRWMLPQEQEVILNREKLDRAEKEWIQKIERWQDALGGDKERAAREGIDSINDPLAVRALTAVLKNDKRTSARILFIQALARINTPAAMKALAVCSMEDSVEEVRLTCLDYLKKEKRPDIVAYYVGQLKSKDNKMVNRAAECLSHMNDRSAVAPLIDALVTTHKFKIVTGNSNPGSVSTQFGKGSTGGGGGGMSVGSAPKIFKQDMRNQSVLDALVMLSGGANYTYDIKAWKSWYAAQKPREAVDARRN